MLLDRIKNYITENELITLQDKVLLGVSGGIDSMVMLDMFSKMDIPFAVAHCNFSLRGKESDDDEVLVRKCAEEYNVEFFSVRFDTHTQMKERSLSLQEAARELRYEWFEKICNKFGYTKIAIAHNSDDTIETFFINLIRGTGIKGLTGISVHNDKRIRPLLFASRAQIDTYALKHKIDYRNDSSNSEQKYLRNKIRHKIIPAISEVSDSFKQVMVDNIARINQSVTFLSDYLDMIALEAVEKEEHQTVVHIDLLVKYKQLEYILMEIIKTYGFKAAAASDIAEAYRESASGKYFFSNSHTALLDREKLIITIKSESIERQEFVAINRNDFITSFNNLLVKIEFLDISQIETLLTPKNCAVFDADTVSFPLMLRYWRSGDSFNPLGMRGKKKVSDFLVDSKVSMDDKQQQTVFVSGDDIIWLTGRRIDNSNKVTLLTSNVLRITIEDSAKVEISFLTTT